MACDDPYVVVLKDPFVRRSSGKKIAISHQGDFISSASVPCGKCGACRKNKVDEWSFRLRQEKKVSDSSFFVTLTYAPEHVPRSDNNFKTLDRNDLTKYFKRLRKWMKDDGVDMPPLKFYAVGEYGDNFERPHYHLIVLNATVDHIIESWCVAKRSLSRSDIRSLGGLPLGFVHVGAVTTDSIAYCVKYLDKGRKVPRHARDDRVKEFSRMSHGLGQSYLTPEMIAWHKADLSRNYIQDGEFKIALPRFYRDQIYTKAERREQIVLSLDAADNADVKARRAYFKDYPLKSEADFLKDKEFQKFFRLKKYTSYGKKRKI